MTAQDIILTTVLIFVFAIGFITVHYMAGQATAKLVALPQVNQSAAAVQTFEAVNTTANRMDYVIFGLFLALLFGIIVGSYFIPAEAIFILVYLLVGSIAVIISAVFANGWEQASQASVLVASLSSFPLTNHLLLNMPYYTAITAFLGICVTFGKGIGGNQ